MGAEGERSNGRRVVYCVLPADLASHLHEPLRRHFRGDPGVEVIVERRLSDRRADVDRRSGEGDAEGAKERRRIRSTTGRRVADRRGAIEQIAEPPPLPRRARRYADRIRFVERVEPTSEQAEDRDTARLVIAFQAGEGREEAFEGIYTRYFDRVYSYLLVALASREEAEDAAQQVFLKALEALPRYERRRQPFRAWLFRIARNAAVDQLRRQGRVEPSAPEELDRQRDRAESGDLELPVLRWISDPDLLLFIERLPAAQRQALILRYTADLTHQEIAEIMDRSTADVRMLTSRALGFLRARLTAVGRGTKSRRRARIRARTREATILRSRRWALRP